MMGNARTYVSLASLLLAGCVNLTIAEDHFFHPGLAAAGLPIAIDGATVESIELPTGGGATLGGISVHRPGAAVDIVYFGGNDFRLDHHATYLARTLGPVAANLLCFDYRGYGRSTGEPTISALKADALAIYDFAASRTSGRPIVVHGFSLGSFMAAYVAENRPVAGLILESTAPSVQRWASRQIPLYAKPFVRLRIAPALLEESNEHRLRNYTGPLLLMTGSADPVTPPAFAESLGRISRSTDKRVVIVPSATHGNVMTFEAARRAYESFLASITGTASGSALPAGWSRRDSAARGSIPASARS